MALRIWNILQKTVVRWSKNDGNLLAASMAYYAAFSFFPLLLVLISALGFVLKFSTGAQNAQQQLLELLAQRTTPALADQVQNIAQNILSQVKTRAAFFSWFGALLTFVGAIGIFSQLESAFDRLWQDVTPHARGIGAAVRNALWNRLKAFLTLIGLGILVLVAFAADIAFTAMRPWAEDLPYGASLIRAMQPTFSVALNFVVLTLLYRLIPRAPVLWRHAACGGLTVAVVWQLGSQLVARFMTSGTYTAYGVVGSFIAVMLWVYSASIVLFLGAQLVQVLGHPDDPPAAPIDDRWQRSPP